MLHGFRSRSIWRHRDLRLMLPARAVSAFGDGVAVVALTLRVYSQSHDPWAVTALLLCSAAPIAVLAPVAGRLVDALPFRTLALATSAWQAACCVGLAFAGPAWSVDALVLALQTGQVVAGPSWQALVPSILPAEEVGRAVAASQALTRLAWVAAPAAAGVAVGALGYAAPLLADAATFLALGAAAIAIRARRGSLEAAEETDGRAPFSLRSDALLWPLVLGLCVLVLAGQVTNVVEVFLVRGTLGASATAFGLLGALFAAALVAGSLAAGRAGSDAVRAHRTILAALVLALALVAAGLAPTVAVFALASVLIGVANGALNTDVGSLVLARTPERARGRVLATVNGMTQSASVGALALGGLAGTLLGPRLSFVVAGGAMAAVAVGLLARGRIAGAARVAESA